MLAMASVIVQRCTDRLGVGGARRWMWARRWEGWGKNVRHPENGGFLHLFRLKLKDRSSIVVGRNVSVRTRTVHIGSRNGFLSASLPPNSLCTPTEPGNYLNDFFNIENNSMAQQEAY